MKGKIMSTIILYLSSNLLHVYTIQIFFNMLLGKCIRKKQTEVLMFLGYFAVNSIGFILFNNLFINLTTNIIPLFLISTQYNKSVGSKIFCTCSSCALGMFADLLIFSVFPHESVLIQNGAVQSVLLLIFVFVLKHFVKNRETFLKSNHIWFISAISLGTILIGLLTIKDLNTKSLIVSVILLLINFLNFYMYDKDLKNLHMEHTLQLIKASNRAYRNQIKIMNESQKKIRFLKHDMKNHMHKVSNFILNNEYEKAEKYIHDMMNAITIDCEYVSTGNYDVDCQLNYKLSLAKEMNTDFSCDVSLPKKLVVSSFDMTTILGNLLDNSLNALTHTENKQLKISIKYLKGAILIDVENTYCREYEDNKPRKEKDHGLGLLSVEHVLEKYHGIMKIKQTDTKFFVNVFMYNSLD